MSEVSKPLCARGEDCLNVRPVVAKGARLAVRKDRGLGEREAGPTPTHAPQQTGSYSITSSAWGSRVRGTSMPSADGVVTNGIPWEGR